MGTLISGYANEAGVMLHYLQEPSGETTSITVVFYDLDNPEFIWALQQLESIS